ncbi:MAG: hypothetical protein M3298_09155 [Thermoproteota archaeon]|nr:hypothetical protein [Thermoproteota archaeon]MDQ3808319.1 hypothetical protein [Thermoproteota archaeon]MDQ3882538.1 hypothetical protein [Thermoproteota archaeon]MDQ5842112.1 hypothetical protein [Thermoproteota archaeon]
MHTISDITSGCSRVENSQAIVSRGYSHTFSKKEWGGENYKCDMLTRVKISKDYYGLKKYENSNNYYFDIRR